LSRFSGTGASCRLRKFRHRYRRGRCLAQLVQRAV